MLTKGSLARFFFVMFWAVFLLGMGIWLFTNTEVAQPGMVGVFL